MITVRNIDVGALVNEGSTLLYRIAQTRSLPLISTSRRPIPALRVGQRATLVVPDLGGRKFSGLVHHFQRARPRQPDSLD